jgi:hypothetical protein
MPYTKEKAAEYANAWYHRNKERLKADPVRKERNRKSAADWRENNREKAMLSAAKARAKRFGLDFNIELEDIVVPSHCPILSIPLFFSKGLQTENTPALDRIDNSRGYVKGNVCVISHKANRHKADLSLEDIERLAQYIACRKCS